MNCKVFAFTYVILSVAFLGCHDTRSFESVRKLKTGMTVCQVEEYMGEPISYGYLNDTTEKRSYVYDNPGNGIDIFIGVIYENGVVVSAGF